MELLNRNRRVIVRVSSTVRNTGSSRGLLFYTARSSVVKKKVKEKEEEE